MLWLSVIFDVLFFAMLYTYAETYEYPRGYYLFFTTDGIDTLEPTPYFLVPVFAALSAYVAIYRGYYKLLSTTMLVFNVVLSLASIGIFIYFLMNY